MNRAIQEMFEQLAEEIIRQAARPEPESITLRRLADGEIAVSAVVKIRFRA